MSKFKLLSFCSLLFDNEALTNIKILKLITCCVKAIHAVNSVLWHPGEQAQKSQTDRQTNPTPTHVPRYN